VLVLCGAAVEQFRVWSVNGSRAVKVNGNSGIDSAVQDCMNHSWRTAAHRQWPASSRRRGAYTLVDLLLTLIALIVLAAIAFAALRGSLQKIAAGNKDAEQLRGIQIAMVAFAVQNNGNYPLPSAIDLADQTIQAHAASKDTTANIFSVLIWTGHLSTHHFVSPAEANPRIRQCLSYELDRPASARSPMNALWDPAFSADFTSGKGGNVSYAHLQPAGQRRSLWQNSFALDAPIISNRGPEIANLTYAPKIARPTVTFAKGDSYTFLIHGSKSSWEGNVVYNDGSLEYDTSPAPARAKRITVNGRLVRDTLFFDETDPAAASNAYLGIFTKSGETPADFTAIWD